MAIYLSQFRELYGQLHDTKAAHAAPLLAKFAASNAAILESYRKFRRFNALDNSYQVETEELHSLYALSRVCDVLILPFAPGESWFALSRNQFVEFWQMLGIEAREPNQYHPFWCEIVVCENLSDAEAPPQITDILWPALLWGELLICRAGVRASAGRAWMEAEASSSSPLYFASRRNYREARDLSHGWGGNSQWRTRFRRDYLWNERYVFNADGALAHRSAPFLQGLSAHEWAELLAQSRQFFASNNGDNGALNFAQRESLLVNRCQLRGPVRADEFWPWDDCAVWKQSAPLQS